MPKAALKPCAHPGCQALVEHGLCPAHQAAQTAQYHDPKVQRWYKSARWLRIRAAQLAKEPWCADCLETDIYNSATDCDHITPHRGDIHKFFSGPFQSLCHACHSRKTAAEVLN